MASTEQVPQQVPQQVVIPENENIKRLIGAIAEQQLSVKEMMAAIGLKDRGVRVLYLLNASWK